jgi:hypothetical protein
MARRLYTFEERVLGAFYTIAAYFPSETRR